MSSATVGEALNAEDTVGCVVPNSINDAISFGGSDAMMDCALFRFNDFENEDEQSPSLQS